MSDTCYDLGDIDGDGDLDAMIIRSGLDDLYLNEGGGNFTHIAGSAIQANLAVSMNGAFGDYDGDGVPTCTDPNALCLYVAMPKRLDHRRACVCARAPLAQDLDIFIIKDFPGFTNELYVRGAFIAS